MIIRRKSCSGYPYLLNSSCMGAGFTKAGTPVPIINRTGRALMMRPAQSIFFETGAVLVMSVSFQCLSADNLHMCEHFDDTGTSPRQFCGRTAAKKAAGMKGTIRLPCHAYV